MFVVHVLPGVAARIADASSFLSVLEFLHDCIRHDLGDGAGVRNGVVDHPEYSHFAAAVPDATVNHSMNDCFRPARRERRNLGRELKNRDAIEVTKLRVSQHRRQAPEYRAPFKKAGIIPDPVHCIWIGILTSGRSGKSLVDFDRFNKDDPTPRHAAYFGE